MMEWKMFFAWYDFWWGVYVDVKGQRIFICPFPMIVIEVKIVRDGYVGIRHPIAAFPRSVDVWTPFGFVITWCAKDRPADCPKIYLRHYTGSKRINVSHETNGGE